MSNYHAPLDDMRFALRVHGMLDEVLALPACADLDADTVDAVLEEAAKFAAADWAQSNVKGDKNGAKIKDGVVTVDESSRAAYKEFCDAGWVSLRMPQQFGGQGLPTSVAALTDEMWYAGNLALSLMPLLTSGAISAIDTHASEELKQKFIPKMAEGVWSGTMNLTEPQAGTDLALLASKAVPKENGTYAISGQKIFITWGEHELTENIIHLVLARLPDAPAGTKGISLFIVPKFLINEDGSLGARNSLHCVSIEHKMGIHGSPTCVMQFDGAEGYLVGEPHSGLKAMFTMMNHARLGVGIEGVGVADRAFRHAHAYTQERIQSRDIAGTSPNSVSIIHHPDVRRMLLVQKATIEAERAMYLRVAALLDKAHGHPDPAEAKKAQALVDFMIPVIKTFCTENGVTLTNMAMQCFGGMGYVEETGAAQFVRDVRITPIYEGTNGVQALDFIGRKTALNGGETAMMIQQEAVDILKKLQAAAPDLAENFKRALDLAEKSVIYILTQFGNKQPEKAAAGSFAYTMQMSVTIGAGEMARAYLAAEEALQDPANAPLDENFYRNKQNTARVYFAYVLPQVETYAAQVLNGADSILNIAIDDI